MISVDIKVFIQYGITLSLEEIDRQVSHMQSLIFSSCSFVEDDLFQCQPNQEVLDIIFSHMPLNLRPSEQVNGSPRPIKAL